MVNQLYDEPSSIDINIYDLPSLDNLSADDWNEIAEECNIIAYLDIHGYIPPDAETLDAWVREGRCSNA